MSKINYTATSHPSGVAVAPMQPMWFIKRLSRQGKSEGHWIYVNAPNAQNGFHSEQVVEQYLKAYSSGNPKMQFRKVLTNVYI